jgi:hypothetical protein
VNPDDVQVWAWPEFVDWFSDQWKPGEHMSIISPTGAGKTTFAGGSLLLRRYVLALDAKGGDDTLQAFGFRRLAKWPGIRAMEKRLDDDERHGRPSRYIVGAVVRSRTELPALRATLAQAMDDAWDMGGWTVYADEQQILADRRMMNLAARSDTFLVAARARKLSYVASFQAPKWVGSGPLIQPTWIATSYTRDSDTVNRIAEVLGRPKPEVRGAVKGLDRFCWVVMGRDPRQPYVVTRPPKIG